MIIASPYIGEKILFYQDGQKSNFVCNGKGKPKRTAIFWERKIVLLS